MKWKTSPLINEDLANVCDYYVVTLFKDMTCIKWWLDI